MMAPDTSLWDELEALPAAHRRALLRSLSPVERSRMMTLLRTHVSAREADEFYRYSPWLAAKLRLAKEPVGDRRGGSLTSSTRNLLLRLANGPMAAVPEEEPPAPNAEESLLSSLARLLFGRREAQ